MIEPSTLALTVLTAGMLLVLGDAFWALVIGTFRIPPPYRRRLVFDPQALLSAIILLLVLPTVVQLLVSPPSEKRGVTTLNLEAAILSHFAVVAALLVVLSYRARNSLSDYGLDGHGWRHEMRYGAIGFLASLPPVMIVLFLTLSFRSPETRHPFLKLLSETGNPWAILDVVFAAVVSAPLMEELVFRVVLQGLLEVVLPPLLAILITAIAFAAVHGPYDALPLFPLAIGMGIVFHLRRSYVAVVTLHALFNAFFLILGLWSRNAG